MEKIFIENCCEILDSMRIPITTENREKGPYPYYGANGIQDYVADYIFNDELVLLAEDGGNFYKSEFLNSDTSGGMSLHCFGLPSHTAL